MPHQRLGGEEVERRGQEIYERQIRADVEADRRGEICVIDVETGDYVIDRTMLSASKRLLARHPAGALWAVRIGYDAVYSLGGGLARTKG